MLEFTTTLLYPFTPSRRPAQHFARYVADRQRYGVVGRQVETDQRLALERVRRVLIQLETGCGSCFAREVTPRPGSRRWFCTLPLS